MLAGRGFCGALLTEAGARAGLSPDVAQNFFRRDEDLVLWLYARLAGFIIDGSGLRLRYREHLATSATHCQKRPGTKYSDGQTDRQKSAALGNCGGLVNALGNLCDILFAVTVLSR